ncbi:MAG: hypothetical protein RIS36_971 [Pseudomonadota bacterium]|jgi:hypothetical protein
MAPLHKDLHLTAEFIAFLRGGFHSQIMVEGAASRLSANFLQEDYVEAAHNAFEKLDTWFKELEDGMPLFSTSWSTPDTFDAINAMGLMKDLKRDLLWFADLVEKALAAQNLVDDRESTKILAAGVLRSAATRLSYIETLSDAFLKLKAPERAQQFAAELPEARTFFQTANTIVDLFSNDTPYVPALCERLRIEASLVPSSMRAYAHDARVLINIYSKEFSYELAEIPPHAAKPWLGMNVPAVAAGYWFAYNFTPQDYARWASVGIRGAPLAAYWRRAKFDPEDAVQWIQQGIPPMVAIEWARAGFDAGRTVAMLQRGITDPSKAPRNRDGE